MAKVVLKSLTKKYGNVVAVNNVNLEISDREFVVLVGPSGCGKTTTLRMMAGLEEITEGDIYIGDQRVNDLVSKNRNIAMVFQSYALYPHMNVFDNMAFGLKMRKVPRKERIKLVRDAADILGVQDLLDRKPKQLSGGQRQRVALGRAIVRNPEVFLFDEPLSNLDAKLRVQMRTELVKLHKRLKSTSVYVTHDQVEAMTMGDRIVVMKDGLVQQVGAPLELYNKPANLFVAGFIGSPVINLLPCRMVRENSLVYLETSGFKLQLPEDLAMTSLAAKATEFILGVRPEDIAQDWKGEPSARKSGHIQTKVDVIETLGKETYIDIITGDDKMTAIISPNIKVAIGDDINLEINMDKIHLFSKKQGGEAIF